MVPTHLRWLEVDAPDVLPSAVRAHQLLLWVYLPLVAIASIAAYVMVRGAYADADPVDFAGSVFVVVWVVVFLPPALLGLPVALKARRALANGARDAASRQRLQRLWMLHVLLPALALIALVPCAYIVVGALRQQLGTTT
ncbi:MAG TPA: hypothetical protein VND91_12660 [Candidatus Saccharimonadia bacterium]|nr:hypothetical protein [Candidatus Saccharimonadia bacterium]